MSVTEQPASSTTPEPQRTVRWRRHVILVCILGVALRAVFLAFSFQDPAKRQRTLDSNSYTECAKYLLEGKGFGRLYAEPGEPPPWRWVHELCRTPGYPALLAAFDYLGGYGQTCTVLLQTILNMAVCLAAMFVCRRLWGDWAGLFAGYWLALDVQGVTVANQIMSESPAGILLFFSALLSASAISRRSAWRGCMAGVLMAVAALIRPTTFLLPSLLGLPLLAIALRRRCPGLVWTACAIGLSGNLIVGAWIVRNGLVCGQYTITSLTHFQLIAEHAAHAMARAEGRSQLKTRDELCAQLGLSKTHVRRLALSAEDRKRLVRLTIQTILAHPKAFLYEETARTANMLGGPDKSALEVLGMKTVDFGLLDDVQDYTDNPPRVTWVILGFEFVTLGLLYVLCTVTVWSRVRRKRPWGIMAPVCLVVAASSLVPSLGAPGNPRYRWPAIPVLVMVAAAALAPRRQLTSEFDRTSTPR